MFFPRIRGEIWLFVCGQAVGDGPNESDIFYLSAMSMDVSCKDKDFAESAVSNVFEPSRIKSLNCQSQQLLSALSSACDFKSHFCKQCGPRSDQGPHCLPVCKNRFEKFARIFSRCHKQTTFSDAGFLGILRVKS